MGTGVLARLTRAKLGLLQPSSRPLLLLDFCEVPRFAPLLNYLVLIVAVSIPSLVDEIRSGNPRALARAITAIENRAPQSADLLKALFPHTGHARVIGLTGAPGAGKRTLVDQLAREYRKQNKTIGIIAVDPTSPYTGGAILGDRIRMGSTTPTPESTSAAWPRAALSADSPAPPPTLPP